MTEKKDTLETAKTFAENNIVTPAKEKTTSDGLKSFEGNKKKRERDIYSGLWCRTFN